jgi:hypothetical protein
MVQEAFNQWLPVWQRTDVYHDERSGAVMRGNQPNSDFVRLRFVSGFFTNTTQLVRWYLYSLGQEIDIHTAHWHAETVVTQHRRDDVVELTVILHCFVLLNLIQPSERLISVACRVSKC